MSRDFAQTSEEFLASLDAEIKRLQTMRAQIAAAFGDNHQLKAVGRPKRQGISEEGRRRIAEAQKARWSKEKKASRAPAKKTEDKKTASKKVAAKRIPKKTAAVKAAEQA